MGTERVELSPPRGLVPETSAAANYATRPLCCQVGPEGVEPSTLGLRGPCSAVELRTRKHQIEHRWGYHSTRRIITPAGPGAVHRLSTMRYLVAREGIEPSTSPLSGGHSDR